MMRHFMRLLFAIALSASSLPLVADDALQILPRDFTLISPALPQRLVVEGVRGDLATGQVVGDVKLTSSDEAVVRVENGMAIPVGNGKASITANAGNASAECNVTVVGMDQPFVWSFRNHVQSVLSKSSCNMGACHGAFAGKKGFKLSLRGYDADADYLFLTRQARARRVILSDPGRSLLLTKPTGTIPHKGGVRFAVGSPEYHVLAEWIAAGAPAPHADDPRIERLELLPVKSQLAIAAKQQVIVQAHFSDGHSEDVTRWAKFTSTNESVATVDQSGLVTVTGSGEAVIGAWYLSMNAVATVSVPFVTSVTADAFAGAPRRNFIDELSLAKLQSLNMPPSPPCTDAEFIRRAHLDTIGVLPTADEVQKFLADATADKRDRLIDALLARPEFVDYWTYRWSDLLLVSGERLKAPAVEVYYKWIRSHVEKNTPWDKFVREIVTASGNTLENGAVNFYALHQDPTEMAETVSAAFLGMTIGCAKCHNHPLEKWTNDQYFAFGNLLSRVQAKTESAEGSRTVFAASEGELIQPSKNKPQPPCPLDGQPLAFDDATDRRIPLANWLTSPDNPYFTRAIVNRVWANFLGVGLVENVDDLRLTNPASNEELMAAAAKYLVDAGYDLKSLMRAILQSATYQRSSQALPENVADGRFYSRYYPKRLSAEVLIDAISQVTGVPTQFKIRYSETEAKDYPLGKRALELPDVDAKNYFFKSFGRPARQLTCECERTNAPTMVQVLNISNGDTLNQKLEAKDNRIDKQLAAAMPNEKIIEELYLSALNRLPTDGERTKLLESLANSGEPNKRIVIEDLYWGVLTSKEFLFNH